MARHTALLEADSRGLCCAAGGFHIDPWRPVPVAVITHAHADHARPGSALYYCAADGADVLRKRIGEDAAIEAIPRGQRFTLGGVTLSFHPAGHILGSSQVLVEGDQRWVITGDYKRQHDPTCAPFQPVKCDVLITEATFALPIYRWRQPREVIQQIIDWWKENAAHDRAGILFTYALGKAQRILAELALAAETDPFLRAEDGKPRTVYAHGAVMPLDHAYRAAGIRMMPLERVTEAADAAAKQDKLKRRFAGQLILAPPSAAGSSFMRRFGAGPQFETAFASGWMQVRGIRRRRGHDRGFILSDHADWQDLLRTVEESGANKILATHGYSEVLARHLRDRGLDAATLPAPYRTEDEQ
jgi:putative mRNA 3-end processing factor